MLGQLGVCEFDQRGRCVIAWLARLADGLHQDLWL